MSFNSSLLNRTRIVPAMTALLVSAAVLPAQEVLTVGSGQGAQIFFNSTLTRTFNFGVTTTGGDSSLALSRLDLTLKRDNSVTSDVVVSIYDAFGGTGNLLGSYSVAASSFNNQFGLVQVNITTPITLTSGDYSIRLTTADTNNYFFKAGHLSLATTSGVSLASSLWVPDSNTDGTATTTLSSSTPVLADHALSTKNVNFGNFRVGATLGQTVSLTNSAFYTANNMTESLALASSTGSGATASVPAFSFLNQGQSTNMTVGMSSATAGIRSGTVTLGFNSVKGDSASTTTGATAVGSQTINVSGVGYRAAVASFSTTTVDLGNFRVGASNVTGTTTISNTQTNDAYSEKLKASTVSTSGATVGSMPSLISAGSNASVTVGLASITAGSNSGTVTLGLESDGTGTSGLTALSLGNQAINVIAHGYRPASAGFDATSLDLGKFHVGSTNLSGTVAISNTVTNDGSSEKLKVASASTSGATVGSLPALIAAGGSSSLTVGLSGVSTAGVTSGTVTLGLQSDGTGTSGLSALSLGNQVINVSATGYTGQSIWSTDANGVWNSFAGWDTEGGKPGVDGALSASDTATFGAAATSARTITLGSATPTLRSLTFDNATASYYLVAGGSGSIQLGTSSGNGSLAVQSGSHTISAGIDLAQATTATVATGSQLLLSGALGGSSAFTKAGAGKLTIDSTGSLSGNTTVSAGLLTVNGSIADSSVTVANGGSLGGSGTVGSTVIQSGGTLTPGNSPGDLDVTGNLTWSSGGNYNWQLVDAAGVAGTAWDVVTITGDLDLTGLTSSATYNINLWTLSSVSALDGLAQNFNNSLSYTWTIARVGGSILGFQQSLFNIRLTAANGTTGFANDLGGGFISIQQDGKNLNLVFQPVPEPSTYGLLLGGAALALAALRRRRRA